MSVVPDNATLCICGSSISPGNRVRHRDCPKCRGIGWYLEPGAYERVLAEKNQALADLARLKLILDHPDPYDFVRASTVEARFQMDLWGTEEGFPTAFDGQKDYHFAYLIGYLTGKVAATPDDDLDKKLHRITTIAAAAANWHIIVKQRPRG